MEKAIGLFPIGAYCFIPDVEAVFKLVQIVEHNENDGTLIVVDIEKSSPQQRVKAETAVPVESLEESRTFTYSS